MKKLLVLVMLAVISPITFTSCSTPVSQRTAEVQTLRALGESAKTAMDAATGLLKQGAITVEQWQKVADLYDRNFQPAYRVAVAAMQSDLSLASPDLVAIATQIVQLVGTYTKHP